MIRSQRRSVKGQNKVHAGVCLELSNALCEFAEDRRKSKFSPQIKKTFSDFPQIHTVCSGKL